MDKQKLIFIFFALCILAVPLYLIISSESILENGHRHKLRLEGRDPFDPFRGKFITLNIDNSIICDECVEGEEVFVTMAIGDDGFSRFDKGHTTKPETDDYFKAEILSSWSGQAFIKTDNITKYFINEDKASAAEELMWKYEAENPDDIYLAVRILDGDIRLEDIFVEETPLLEFLEK